jgi:cytosine/uracil/thiamine/allantoin permease
MTCSPPPQGGVQWPVVHAVACGACSGLWGVQWPVGRAVPYGARSGMWCVGWPVGRAVACGACCGLWGVVDRGSLSAVCRRAC